MQLEIITPEQRIFSGEAEAVQLPGKEGRFQILDSHAPLISTLQAGVVKIDLPGKAAEEELHTLLKREKSSNSLSMQIKGGVAEVQQGKLILLAD